MRVTLFAIVVSIFSATLSAQTGVKLEIDATLPAKYAARSKAMTATAASQVFPYVDLTIRKVKYRLAFDEDDRSIKYIFTMDQRFVDSNGLRVGRQVTVKYEDIDVLPYFQLRTKPDKNGWQAVIGNLFSFHGDLLERIEIEGKFTTRIEGFAKGYNY